MNTTPDGPTRAAGELAVTMLATGWRRSHDWREDLREVEQIIRERDAEVAEQVRAEVSRLMHAYDLDVQADTLTRAARALDKIPTARERMTYGRERDIADGVDIGIETAAKTLRSMAEQVRAGTADDTR